MYSETSFFNPFLDFAFSLSQINSRKRVDRHPYIFLVLGLFMVLCMTIFSFPCSFFIHFLYLIWSYYTVMHKSCSLRSSSYYSGINAMPLLYFLSLIFLWLLMGVCCGQSDGVKFALCCMRIFHCGCEIFMHIVFTIHYRLWVSYRGIFVVLGLNCMFHLSSGLTHIVVSVLCWGWGNCCKTCAERGHASCCQSNWCNIGRSFFYFSFIQMLCISIVNFL